MEVPGREWSAAEIKDLHEAEIQIAIPATIEVPVKAADENGIGSLLPLDASVDGVDAFIACLRTDRLVRRQTWCVHDIICGRSTLTLIIHTYRMDCIPLSS